MSIFGKAVISFLFPFPLSPATTCEDHIKEPIETAAFRRAEPPTTPKRSLSVIYPQTMYMKFMKSRVQFPAAHFVPLYHAQ